MQPWHDGDADRGLTGIGDLAAPGREAAPRHFRLSTFDFRLPSLVLLALAYRLILLRTTMATVDSDQAVAGVMARHVLRGERPIFFYGQSYNGALEAYLTAAVFRLLGQGDLTLRLAHTLFSVALVVQLYVLARRLYSPRVAVAAGLWLAVPAPILVWWGAAAGASYIEAMVFGTGILLIAVRRWWLGRPRPHDLPALGLLAGLGWWAHPMIAYYLLALAAAALPLTWRSRARLARALPRQVPPAAAFFALGAAPWLAYALGHRGAGLTVLSGRPGPYAWPDVLRRLCTQALPVLAGGAHLSGPADQFARYIAAHPVPYALSLCGIAYVAARLVLSPRGLGALARRWLAARPPADAPLAALLVAVFALYLASRYKGLSWTTRDPRYLLPLYTCAPYLIACALGESKVESRKSKVVTSDESGVGSRESGVGTNEGSKVESRKSKADTRRLADPPEQHRLMGRGRPITIRTLLSTFDFRLSTLALALALNVYGAARYGELPSSAFPDVAPLAKTLLGHGDEAVYGDYWVVWRLAFASGERLTPVVTLGLTIDHNPRGARYPPYLARAARARRWAYIVPDHLVPALLARLRRRHLPYHRWRWGTSALFYNHWDWGRPNVVEVVSS